MGAHEDSTRRRQSGVVAHRRQSGAYHHRGNHQAEAVRAGSCDAACKWGELALTSPTALYYR